MPLIHPYLNRKEKKLKKFKQKSQEVVVGWLFLSQSQEIMAAFAHKLKLRTSPQRHVWKCQMIRNLLDSESVKW